jgi:hypothetical protein
MGRSFSQSFATLTVVALLGLLPLAVAHGHDEGMNKAMERPTIPTESDSAVADPTSYFRYGEHSSLMVGHIVLMTIGWVFVLPISEL